MGRRGVVGCVRTWDGGGHSGGGCGLLLDVMYALLGLPAAGLLLVFGGVGGVEPFLDDVGWVPLGVCQ